METVKFDRSLYMRYIPASVVDFYVKCIDRSAQPPMLDQFVAATGFFDVSGFSTLGDFLFRQEKASGERQFLRKRSILITGKGAESLTQNLNLILCN